MQGGAARALTAGKFEVTHFVFSQDRKRLVYSSTQDDTDRMHLWTVDAEHGSAVRADQSHAIEEFPQIGRMCCAPCTSNVRKYGSPSLLMCICGSLWPEFRRPGCSPR